MGKRICSVDGCDREVHGNGLCSWHYQRQRKGKSLDDPWKQNRHDRKRGILACSIPGCKNKVYRRNLCSGHVQREKLGLPMDSPLNSPGIGEPCNVPGCNNKAAGRHHGLCKSHFRHMQEQEKKKWLVEQLGGKCAHCGGIFPAAVYDFHHLDPARKDIHPGQGGYTRETIKEVLEKCVPLCSNCHRLVHYTGDVKQYVNIPESGLPRSYRK